MPVADALKITSRLCDALDHMHKKKIIHRDLKPENVMICNDGTLRIMDFGIAKAAGMRRLTFGGFSPVMGTPDYMAPEQVKGKRGDERTDIYSLGAILYEMVTGGGPVRGANPYIIMNSRLTGDPVAPTHGEPADPAAGGGDHPPRDGAQPGRSLPLGRRHESRHRRARHRPRDRAGQPSAGPGPDARLLADRPDRPRRDAVAGGAVLSHPVHVEAPLAHGELLAARPFGPARTPSRAARAARRPVPAAPPSSPHAMPVPAGNNLIVADGRLTFVDPARAGADPGSWLDAFEAAVARNVPEPNTPIFRLR